MDVIGQLFEAVELGDIAAVEELIVDNTIPLDITDEVWIVF